jgi:peptidoglycan/LPS O-acetylase OafA/YrhL
MPSRHLYILVHSGSEYVSAGNVESEVNVSGQNASQPVAAGRRLGYLDALRGLASAYVVLFHLRYVGSVEVPSSLATFVSLGGTGVMLFFVVSCFSLFYTMPARFRQSRPYFAFYVHRFFRIAPLFYIWLVVETALNVWLYHYPTSVGLILQNAFFVFNLVPGSQGGIVMASWTIGVEMLFYLIFPLVYLVTKSVTDALAFTVASALAYFGFVFVLSHIIPDAAGSYASWTFLKDLPVFAMGAVCFFLVRQGILSRGDGTRDRGLGVLLLSLGIYVMVARSANWIDDGIFGGHPYIWPGIAYSLMLVGLSLNPLSLVDNRVTAFLGKVSYSLYLAHAPIILLFAYFGVYIWLVGLLGVHLGFVASLLLTFAVALPVAYVTYRLVELPGISLGKRFYARAIGWPLLRPVDRSGASRRPAREPAVADVAARDAAGADSVVPTFSDLPPHPPSGPRAESGTEYLDRLAPEREDARPPSLLSPSDRTERSSGMPPRA